VSKPTPRPTAGDLLGSALSWAREWHELMRLSMRVLVCGARADRQSLSAAVAAAVMIKSSGSCSGNDSIAGIRSESTYQVMLRLPSTSQLFAQTNSCKPGTDEPTMKSRIILVFDHSMTLTLTLIL
jgi:hypothetical protein